MCVQIFVAFHHTELHSFIQHVVYTEQNCNANATDSAAPEQCLGQLGLNNSTTLHVMLALWLWLQTLHWFNRNTCLFHSMIESTNYIIATQSIKPYSDSSVFTSNFRMGKTLTFDFENFICWAPLIFMQKTMIRRCSSVHHGCRVWFYGSTLAFLSA